jgi:hypothetical protein
MQGQPFIIQYLVGLAISRMGYQVLLDVPRLSPGPVDYERILSRLEEADRAPRRPFRQLECEKLSAWDFTQRSVHDTDGDGFCDRLALPPGRMPQELPRGNIFARPQTFDAVIHEIDEYYTTVRDVFVADYQKSRKHAAACERNLKANGGPVIRIFGLSLQRVSVVLRHTVAYRHAYRLVFRVHVYRTKRGHWPRTLQDALPAAEARKLTDPFANKPFRYRLKNGEPLLYSVSDNGIDDGGQVYRKDGRVNWGQTGDYVLWPPQTN